MQLGVQFPSRQPANSSIGSISYQDGKVNIKGKSLSEIGGIKLQERLSNADKNRLEILTENAHTTRDIVAWAKDNGYDGVIIKNIIDSGKYGYANNSDVYIFFNPQVQVKTADPVTYDDNGNVIPLSERFNKTNEDIRYSLREVEPVQPTSDKWKKTSTTSEVMARFPNLWNVAAEESETRNPTQITGTVRKDHAYDSQVCCAVVFASLGRVYHIDS